MVRASLFASVFLCAMLAFAVPQRARAQAASGSIFVEVRDARAGTAVSRARVSVTGPVQAVMLSDADGTARFPNLPPGTYSIMISAAQHLSATVNRVSVAADESTVSVDLAPNSLSKIGGVRVATHRNRRDVVDTSSAAGRLSDDPLDALGRLPGVQTSSPTDDNGFRVEGISIEGHPVDQTGISIDGLPLVAPGLSRDVMQYAADLFAGARVAYEPQPGAPGGSVDFSTVNPSLQWRGQYSGTTGAHDLGVASYTVSGSRQGFGIVAVRSIRGSENALAGHRYFDTSGLDYRHAGSTLRDGSLEKIQKAFGDGSFATLTILDAKRRSDLICVEWYNSEPCGLGPGNEYSGGFRFRSLQLDNVIGHATLRAAAYIARTDSNLDLLQRYVAGSPAPLDELGSRRTSGTTLQSSIGTGAHEVQVSGTAARVEEHDSVLFGRVRIAGNSTQRFELLKVSDVWTPSQKVRVGSSTGTLNTDAGSGPFGSLSTQYKPGEQDTFSVFAAAGRQASPLTPAAPFVADPAALRFSCSAQLAIGPGGSDAATAQSATTVRFGWNHAVGTSGYADLAGYQQVQRGNSLRLPVSSVVVAPGTIGAAYFAAADAEFSSPVNCGRPVALQPGDVYLGQLVSGIAIRYRGLRMTTSVDASRKLTVQGFVAVQEARIETGDSRLAVPQSYYHSGDALPGVPRIAYGATADYKPTNGFVEWLASVRGFGTNNGYGRGSLVFMDLAAHARLLHGSVVARVSNVFSAGASDFALPTGVPRFTADGRRIPQLAYPIAPRAVSFTYTVPLGKSYDRAPGSTRELIEGRDSSADLTFTPLPSTPPRDSFEIRNGSRACPLVKAQRVARLLSQLESLTRKLVATAGRYPETPPGNLPSAPGYEVRYRSVGSSYVITIVIRNVNSLTDWVGCTRLHRTTEAEAAQRGLYGSAVSFEGFVFHYTPAVGFYAIASERPLAPARRYDIDVPNVNPFDTLDYPSCTASLRPIAASLLADLRRVLAAGLLQSDSRRFQLRVRGATSVIEIVDPLERGAVLNCARIASATADELRRRGLEGEPEPALNYTARYGLFVIAEPQSAASLR